VDANGFQLREERLRELLKSPVASIFSTAQAERVMALTGEWITARSRSSSRPRRWEAAYTLLAAPLLVRRRGRIYLGRAAGHQTRIACIGRQHRFEDLIGGLTDGAEPAGDTSAQNLWAPHAIARTGADLIGAEIHPWAAPRFRRTGFAIVPEFVRWCGTVRDLPPARRSKSLRGDLNKVARAGYVPELVERPTPDDWRQFWEGMVRPYLSRRFAGKAWIPMGAYMRAVAKRGSLLFVTRDGQRVGGTALVRHGNQLWIALMGFTDGDASFVREGAAAALYLFEIEQARQAGVARIDIGRTSPFLADGVGRYKGKFGYRPERDPLSPLVAIKIDAGHPGLSVALSRNPLLIDDGTGLARFPA
jgi:hypothetical protein